MSAYSNPENTCFQCTDDDDGEQGCCDRFASTSCEPDERCDNEFFYCLMPSESTPLSDDDISDTVPVNNRIIRADRLGCLQPSTAQRSSINMDGEMINFLSERVLGLPNPLEFEVAADRWQVSLVFR